MLYTMRDEAAIYGFSRGHKTLAIVALFSAVVSFWIVYRTGRIVSVPLTGGIGFFALSIYAWTRGACRIVVLVIQEDGFEIRDPAMPLGLIKYTEIQELRIFATLEHPLVGFALHKPHEIRRRGPAVLRWLLKPVWTIRPYPIVVQLDGLNDQVMAIKSTALKAGIPVNSELV